MTNELLKLYELGFSIHWLRPKSKVPIENKWSSRDRKTLNQLKEQYKPGLNVGVRPGLTSKLGEGYYLAIIDCDVKSDNEAHLAEMEKALVGLFPEYYLAPTVISGRNNFSRHIYVRVHELKICGRFQMAESKHKVKYHSPSKTEITQAEREKLSAKELDEGYRLAKAWEITFMCDGAQVVLPPSIHPDSKRAYFWESEIPKSVDDFPIYEPSKAKDAKATSDRSTKLEFELLDDVALYELPVSGRIMALLQSGQDVGGQYSSDRSAMIMACINAMVSRGVSDQLIVSVLTDSENGISEKALEKGSRLAGARWVLSQVRKARTELAADSGFDSEAVVENELTDAEAAEQDELATHWTDRLEKNKNDNKVKNTAKNRDLIFAHAFERDTLRLNEFLFQVEHWAEPPWAYGKKIFKGQELTPLDITAIRSWLSKKWRMEVPEADIWASVQLAAAHNPYHPVRDYINSLDWDGVDRIDRWMQTYMGAIGDERYVSAIGSKMLIAAVARVFDPGCKFDNVVVLEGGQGVGKSTAIGILGGKWATDAHIDPNNKDTINTIQGKWIVEMAEMVPAHRSDAESLKAFISKTEDRARLAFERKAQTYPRQCIFIGSTNKDEYFQDETGNRRFWPVKVGQVDFKKLKADRDQLWAEAYYRYWNGEPLWLEDKQVIEIAKIEQSSRMMVDEWVNDINHYLQANPNKEYYTSKEFFDAICGLTEFEVGSKSFSKNEQMRIGKILKTIGFERIKKRVNGVQTKVWVRESEGSEW